MINVKFFGVLRLDLGVSGVQIEASDVKELCKVIPSVVEKATEKELKSSIIFVNGKNITKLKMYKTKLSDNDEVLFMAAVGGG